MSQIRDYEWFILYAIMKVGCVTFYRRAASREIQKIDYPRREALPLTQISHLVVYTTASLVKYIAFTVWNHTFAIFPPEAKNTLSTAAVNSRKADRLCYKQLRENLKSLNTQRQKKKKTWIKHVRPSCTKDDEDVPSFQENSAAWKPGNFNWNLSILRWIKLFFFFK